MKDMGKKKKTPSRNHETAKTKMSNQSRTASGKVPQGRTLTTQDKFLDRKAKQPDKKRPVVVIETNADNDLAVVQ